MFRSGSRLRADQKSCQSSSADELSLQWSPSEVDAYATAGRFIGSQALPPYLILPCGNIVTLEVVNYVPYLRHRRADAGAAAAATDHKVKATVSPPVSHPAPCILKGNIEHCCSSQLSAPEVVTPLHAQVKRLRQRMNKTSSQGRPPLKTLFETQPKLSCH